MASSGVKKPIQPKISAKPTLVLPNVLLLPPAHHKKWGWLVWTVLLVGLLLGLLYLLRGCKPASVPTANAEAPRAYYGTFEVIEGGPSNYSGTPAYRDNALSMEAYHRTMPDGRILFVDGLQSDPEHAPKGSKLQVFMFDPKTNQFETSPVDVRYSDGIPSLSYVLTEGGQLAVFSLDAQVVSGSGDTLLTVGGASNPKFTLYNPQTGEKTEVPLTGEDFSKSRFAYKPYIFEVDGGILVGAREYTEFTDYRASKWQAVTFFYDYQTKQMTKKVGSIGLPDNDSSTANPVVPLTNSKALVIDQANLFLFDYKTQKASFKRRLTAYQQGHVLSARLVPNSSLVYIIVSGEGPKADAYSVIYLYNFDTNSLHSYRLGNKPLQQGKVENIKSALSGEIPREDAGNVSDQPTQIVEDKNKTYWLQPLLDGTVLVTGDKYYNLPWSYGLTDVVNNQWLARANTDDIASLDPKNNYAEKMTTLLPETNTLTAYTSTIQDSILLPDGRVLFAGPVWFIYTPSQSKTTFQTTNPASFGGKINQVGRWTDGGKLIIDKADQDLINSTDPTLIDSDYSNFSGTPYPLKDGRVFFYKPVYKSTSYAGDPNKDQLASDVIGQIYNPSTGKSKLVKSGVVKGLNLSRVGSYSITNRIGGVVDAKGNVHIFGYPSGQELIYYPDSGKTKLRTPKPLKDSDAYSNVFTGIPVAVDNFVYFFNREVPGTVGVFNVKTGRYYNLANQLENDWLKKHPKAAVTKEVYAKITSGLPNFDGTSCQVADPSKGMILPGTLGSLLIPGVSQVACPIQSAIYLGNYQILLASGNQLKIFNYKTLRTTDLPNLKNFVATHKLFRMSDGRVAVVGEATLPTGEFWRSGDPETANTPVIEVVDIAKQTVSDPITNPYFPIQKTNDVSYDAWILPNDRLLFSAQLGTRLALYDLQQQRWLAQPESLANLGYGRDYAMMQLPNKPTIIKLSAKLQYTDYTKEIPVISDVARSNEVVLPAGAVEVYIPEAGPWGYYDITRSRFNWWMWLLTLQLVQGLAGIIIMITRHKAVRRFLIPL